MFAAAEQNCSLPQILYNLGYFIFSFKLLRKYWSSFSKIKHFKLVSQIPLKRTYYQSLLSSDSKIISSINSNKNGNAQGHVQVLLRFLVVIILFIGIMLLFRWSTGLFLMLIYIYFYGFILIIHKLPLWRTESQIPTALQENHVIYVS